MYYLETKGNFITKTPSWSTKCIFFVHFDYQKIGIYAYYCYNSGAISSLGVKFNEITSHLHMYSLVDAFQIYIYIENDLVLKHCNCLNATFFLKCYNFNVAIYIMIQCLKFT